MRTDSPKEYQAILCPVGQQIVLLHGARDESVFSHLSGLVLDLADKVTVNGPAAASTDRPRARMFVTTPEIEELLAAGGERSLRNTPGHLQPVVVDKDGRIVRQIPLKEVDPQLLAAAANPAVLAVQVATKVILQRLDAIERVLLRVAANVDELIDRANSQQQARLRATVDDLADAAALPSLSEADWRLIAEHRETLTGLHHEFCQELDRTARRLSQTQDPVRRWTHVEPRDAARIDSLVQQELLVLQALHCWSHLFLEHRPIDDASETVVTQTRQRLETVRAEAQQAFLAMPRAEIPHKSAVTRLLAIGPIRAGQERTKAVRHRRMATPTLSHAIESTTDAPVGQPLLLPVAKRQAAPRAITSRP